MQYYPKIAFEPVGTQHTYQEKALKDLLVYLQRRSPFYRKLFDKHHINVGNIRSIKDLRFLPTTNKLNLQENNWQFLCIPDHQVREYIDIVGCLGRPVTIAMSDRDYRRLAYSARQVLSYAGGGRGSIYQLMLSPDQQAMSGMATYTGIRQLGGSVIRVGKTSPQQQWQTMQRIQPDTIIAAPSFILRLAEWACVNDVDLHSSPAQKAICIDESIRSSDFELNVLGSRILTHWPLKLYNAYTSTEMQTAFVECECGMGVHHIPDLSIVEVLNDNDEVLSPGEYGEVTITTLGVEGMPLLRYRTGDICAYYDTPCACGRSSRRLSPVLDHKQHEIKFKGATLYPQMMQNLLNQVHSVKSYIIEIFTNNVQLDDICLHVHTSHAETHCENEIRHTIGSWLPELPLLKFHSEEALRHLQQTQPGTMTTQFMDKR